MILHTMGEKYNVHLKFKPEDKALLKAIANVFHTTYTGAVLTLMYEYSQMNKELSVLKEAIMQDFKSDLAVCNPKNYGDYLKNARLFNNMSQQELAEKMGFKHKASISKYEKSYFPMKAKDIIKAAEILGVTPAYLMGWSGPKIETASNRVNGVANSCLAVDTKEAVIQD